MRQVWQNNYARLFRKIDNDFAYCDLAFVETLKKIYKREKRPYTLVIAGYLPACAWLVKLKKGEHFEILHKECSNPAIYTKDATIIRLTNCEPMEFWMDKVAVQDAGHPAIMTGYTLLYCDAEIITGDGKCARLN